MKEDKTVNTISSWHNVVNLVNVKVHCEMCGKELDINNAVFYEGEGYYCPSCDKRIYRGEELGEMHEEIKQLKETIVQKDNMIIELTNTIEELENELNAYKNNKSEEECTLGYEAYGVCDHGDITD